MASAGGGLAALALDSGARSRRLLVLAVPALFWALFAVFTAFNTYLSMLSHHHSLARLVAFQLVVCGFWAAATPAVVWLARRFDLVPLRFGSLLAHVLCGAALATLHLAWSIAATVVMRPYDRMSITTFRGPFLEVLQAHLHFEMLTYWGILGAVYAFRFHERSRERALRAAELERELAQARLAALSGQLQPHFLFNALHTVSGLVRADEREAAIATVAGLSDLLRYALENGTDPEVTLGEEVEVARRYLAIQGLRYGDRLSVAVAVEPAALAARVPRLLLQPLLENALRHGAEASSAAARVELRAARRDDALVIAIGNSTHAAAAPSPAGHGIGLHNTRERLAQLYGPAAALRAHRRDGWFELDLTLPWRERAAGDG